MNKYCLYKLSINRELRQEFCSLNKRKFGRILGNVTDLKRQDEACRRFVFPFVEVAMPQTKDLPVSTIKILPATDAIDQDFLASIKESILINRKLGHGYDGLLDPVKVYAVKNEENRLILDYYALDSEYQVIAFSLLGIERIACDVYSQKELPNWDHAHLVRIDSRLVHKPIDVIERGELINQREDILVRLGMRAKKGDNQHTLKGKKTTASATVAVPKTTREIAAEMGMSQRSVYNYRQIAATLAPEVKQIVRDKGLENSTKTLLQIVAAGPTQQEQMEVLKQMDREEKQREQMLAAAAQKQSGVAASKSPAKDKNNVIPINRLKSPVSVVAGEWWQVYGHHQVWCGSTSAGTFVENAPESALAIAPMMGLEDEEVWSYDWLIDRADIVAVPCTSSFIYKFLKAESMGHYKAAFPCWLYDGNKPKEAITVFLYSSQMTEVNVPKAPPKIYSLGNLMELLITSYSQRNDTIISPVMPNEVLLHTAYQTNRITYQGGDRPESVTNAINEFRKLTGRAAKRVDKRSDKRPAAVG